MSLPKEIPLPQLEGAFEALTLRLFREIWNDPSAQLIGRRGQEQAGVDVHGEDRARGTGSVGVQCKLHGSASRISDQNLLTELKAEVEKAKKFKPPLDHFVFATTAPHSATLQERAREITEKHRAQGLFSVEFKGWEDIKTLLDEHETVRAWYLGDWAEPALPDLLTGRLPVPLPQLIGREAELERLDIAWKDPAVHVLVLVAFGGVGKSALVQHWMNSLAAAGWPGARRVFDWSFYSQGSEERVTSSDRFFDEALAWFGDADPRVGSPHERGQRLAGLVRKEKTLLVLDGIEPLQYASGPWAGRLKDPALSALLKGLAAGHRGLCVVTTREHVTDLDGHGRTVPQELLEHLSSEAGAELLRQLGVKGRPQELLAASEELKNHALAVSLLGRYLATARGGRVERRSDVELAGAAERQGGHALRVIGTYAEWLGEGPELAVLRLIGLFDRPANPKALAALRAEPVIPGLTDSLTGLIEEDWNTAVTTLRGHGLLLPADDQKPGTLDAHPLVRFFFQEELEKQRPHAWQAGNLRLFEHLQKEAPDLPDSLEAMEPLYTAVIHGCRAGRQQEAFDEVYWRRILQGNDHFSWRMLGAFSSDLSALSAFFDHLWNQPSSRVTEKDHAFVLNQAGLCLRALGRLAEAVQPMEAGLEIRLQHKTWKNAARIAGNLSNVTLLLGEVKRAVAFGKQSVDLADRGDKAFLRIVLRAALADALHQAGRCEESARAFHEAEALQSDWQPQYSRLYSLQGYQYCDLLLSRGEPEDGSGMDDLTANPKAASQFREACREVRERAEQFVAWRVPDDSLLDIGLDHLSLGRAHLGSAVTAPQEADLAKTAESLDRAVEGVRLAGAEEFIPRALLARAALRRHRGDLPAAEADLSEALETAERGSMRLHECDAHLEWARLCRQRGDLDGLQRHVARARKLVEETGYERRKREVEWLERALTSVPSP